MLRRNFVSFLSGVVGLWLASNAYAAPAVGQPAPDFSLTDTAGKVVRLSDFRGKHVVLEWTNPGCPFVCQHYGAGNMQALQREAAVKGTFGLACGRRHPLAPGRSQRDQDSLASQHSPMGAAKL
ncbi:redoxin domain-containing protein [Rhodoferax sp.]|uniref:redoxin domain-containing protein n=1 Tax=Rhodoferax sp. TaxID=50421 RepID=UPI0039B9968A